MLHPVYLEHGLPELLVSHIQLEICQFSAKQMLAFAGKTKNANFATCHK